MPGHFTALGHQGQASTPSGGGPLGHAVHGHAAGCHGDLAGDGLQQGAFAGAVGSHQGGEAAGSQGKRQVLQDGAIATTHRQVSNVQGGDQGQGDLASATNLAMARMKTIIIFKIHFYGPFLGDRF
jgi:hypothetical protein